MSKTLEDFISEYEVHSENKNTLSFRGKNYRDRFKFDDNLKELISLKFDLGLSAMDVNRGLFKQCLEHFEAQKPVIVKDTKESGGSVAYVGDIFDLLFIIPTNTRKVGHVICYNQRTKKLMPHNYNKEMLSMIAKELGKELYLEFERSNLRMYTVVYEPKNKKVFYDDKVNMFFNTYRRPDYLDDYNAANQYGSPKGFLALLSQVFPVAGQRDIVEEFLYYCISNIRAKNALVAIGRQGAGKGTIFNKTLGILVGIANHYSLAASFTKSQFDSGLRNHTVAFADEVELRSKAVKNKYKNLIGNDTASLEEKHVSVTQSEPIHCNFIFASNYRNDFFIELEDRLFLFPDMAEEKLEVAMGDEWVKNYVDSLQDQETAREIYHYLTNKFGHITESRILKMDSENTKQMVHRNDKDYRVAFIECCYYGKPDMTSNDHNPSAAYFTIRDVKIKIAQTRGLKENTGKLPSVYLNDILQYLENYEKAFGRKIAEYVEFNGAKVFKSLVYKDEEFGNYVK